jgi:hypothetical protein
MKDDDPEKRILELDGGLADVTRGFQPPRRKSRSSLVAAVVVLGFLAPTIGSLAVFVATSDEGRSTPGATDSSTDPSGVPPGGELRVGGIAETKTIACNDGKLTLDGQSTDYSITGHCASLTVAGYNNHVTVDSAYALESTGHGNGVTVLACNNGNLKLSSYGIKFDVTGHCASVAISSFGNNVSVESVDRINVSGDSNVVTYHSPAPKITDSGHLNNIHQG